MNNGMKSLPAEFVEDGHYIMARSTLMKVLNVEWPFAVVREFSSGEFGLRSYVELHGKYHIPSTEFLCELGLYKDDADPLYVIMSDRDAEVLTPCPGPE